MPERRPLWDVIRPLVYAGWAVALIRFAMEWFAPDQAHLIGVYYVMPVVLLVLGVRRHFADVGYLRFLLAVLAIVALVWVVPNCFSYTVAQFMEWTHGRFRPPGEEFIAAGDPFGDPDAKGPAIAATALGKIGTGLLVGCLTGIAGFVWMLPWGTIVGWLPSKLLGRTS